MGAAMKRGSRGPDARRFRHLKQTEPCYALTPPRTPSFVDTGQLLGLLIVALVVPAHCSEKPGRLGADIVEFGTVRQVGRDEVVPIKPSAGETNRFAHRSEAEFIAHTDHVVARKGVSFGFRYRLVNADISGPLDLEHVTTHPDFLARDGRKISSSTTRLRLAPKDIRSLHYLGYTFDENSEMVAGDWTISLRHEGRIIVSKTFRVDSR